MNNKSKEPSLPQQQQQQQVQATLSSTYNEQEECLLAQRAAMEAIQVGRATVEQAQLQHEQLNRAESLADETQYKLDKAGRVLRGMESWGGWIANKFTKDVVEPISLSMQSHGMMNNMTAGKDNAGNKNDNNRQLVAAASPGDGPKIYETLPDACQPTAQAIQNYHVNVQVLEQCLDEEQKQTCGIICQDMYRIASQQLQELKSNHPKSIEAYWIPLEQDLEHLQKRQVTSLQRIRFNNNNNINQQQSPAQSSALTFTSAAAAKESKSAGSPSKSLKSNNGNNNNNISEDAVRLQQQDEHLNVLGQALGELSHIAKSLNQSLEQQNETMDSLHDKSDSMLVKAQLNTRRADRLIQNKSWTPRAAPTFSRKVTIRHLATGKYLAVVKGDLYLLPQVNRQSCVFSVWTRTRQGRIFGLQNKCTDKWAGQSLFGSLVCTSSTFGRREEWEADSDEKDDVASSEESKHWNRTRLLCASAGWGAGGYLTVRMSDFAVSLSGATAEDRKNADFWCIQETND